MKQISTLSLWKLTYAAAVPMLAVLGLIMIDSTSRFALVIFSAGLAAALTATRDLQDKVQALRKVIRRET